MMAYSLGNPPIKRLIERTIKYEPIREVLIMIVYPLCLIVNIPIEIKHIKVKMLNI